MATQNPYLIDSNEINVHTDLSFPSFPGWRGMKKWLQGDTSEQLDEEEDRLIKEGRHIEQKKRIAAAKERNRNAKANHAARVAQENGGLVDAARVAWNVYQANPEQAKAAAHSWLRGNQQSQQHPQHQQPHPQPQQMHPQPHQGWWGWR